MVMENNEIIEIYTKLSGGKKIDNDSYVIDRSHFSSLLYDRFIVELSKRKIKWDGSSIMYIDLINSNPLNIENTYKSESSFNINTIENGVGIDVQDINELPDCIDYWEDDFYKSKFTSIEIAYCVQKNNIKQSFAGIYSLKESLIKSDNSLEWNNIEINHDEFGKPYYCDFNVSISHSSNYVISIALRKIESILPPSENLTIQEPLVVPKKPLIVIFFNLLFIVINIMLITYIVIKEFFNR
jgi:phosphopantetheine--protein transferase-like protein